MFDLDAYLPIDRVTVILVVFEKLGTLLLVLKLNFQAMIKSAASAADSTAWELRQQPT